MQGIGNDFVMLDALREEPLPADLPAFARMACDRRFGVGGDGIIVLERGDEAPLRMRMLNPDGSESEMCGNGLRCLGRLIQDHGHADAEQIPVETGAGVLQLRFVERSIQIDMGRPRLTRGEIGMAGPTREPFVEMEIGDGLAGTAVSMGNPHLVVFVDDVAAVDLERLGPKLENHPLFPARTNVHFVQVADRTHLLQRTWERGAGVTLACGTGACSAAVAAVLTNRADRSVDIRLPGGHLQIELDDRGHVLMTGPTETVFEGELGDLTL